MPADFEKCMKAPGHYVRRVVGKDGLAPNEYVNYCVVNGKSYRGEVHKLKKIFKKKK